MASDYDNDPPAESGRPAAPGRDDDDDYSHDRDHPQHHDDPLFLGPQSNPPADHESPSDSRWPNGAAAGPRPEHAAGSRPSLTPEPPASGFRPPPPAPSPAPSEREWQDVQPARRSGEGAATPRPRPGRTGSGQLRTCKKCSLPLTGQFVRALAGTFHLDCFKCRDCGQIVASKFFPSENENGEGQYPLCETDYFRRLGLLCYQCGGALRGSYITALDRKYHVNHFTCSVCPTEFGAQDSYYEHEGQVYCHYHYSTQFAQRCNGCRTAILKQFVEIFRNGQNQHWHPECYMIHKFWNVRLARPDDSVGSGNLAIAGPDAGAEGGEGGEAADGPHRHEESSLATDAATADHEYVREEEEKKMDDKVYKIWSVLSAFEESSAACISDMLLHVSNGAYVDGIAIAKRFIFHVEVLFGGADNLDGNATAVGAKNLTYGREAKLLCKKIVAFFSLVSKAQDTAVKKLGVTPDLLSLVTGLAHYLKLLIRICLQGALRVEREAGNSDCVYQFLSDLEKLESIKSGTGPDGDTATPIASLMSLTSAAGQRLSAKDSDHCALCEKSLEDECAKFRDMRWHVSCVRCVVCARDLGRTLSDAHYSAFDRKIYCQDCTPASGGGPDPDPDSAGPDPDPAAGFEHVTKLQQYVFLLQVAMARLMDRLQRSGLLPRMIGGEEDPSMVNGQGDQGTGPDGRPNRAFPDPQDHRRESSYEMTRDEVAKLRNTRLDRSLSSSVRKARMSRIMDRPEGRSARPGSAGATAGDGHSANHRASLQIVEDRDMSTTDMMFGHQEGLTLDDIPRIVAAEQVKEQFGKSGPGARRQQQHYQQQQHQLQQQQHYPHQPHQLHQLQHQHQHQQLADRGGLGLGLSQQRPSSSPGIGGPGIGSEYGLGGGLTPGAGSSRLGRRFFSELSGLEYFTVRHLAVLKIHPMVVADFSQEELLGFIEQRKQTATFWKNLGKAFGKNDGAAKKLAKKKGVFAVPLEVILERDGADSTDGVGPGALRIPAIVDNIISAMKQMDLSVEGVFRKNGNIKKQLELVDVIDRDGCDNINFMDQPVVQIAALLKRYLRDLPDPLMTHKLYRLWLAAAKIPDLVRRRECLHLTCCLLPKCHRDCLEILFRFLKWAGTFHQVDEESGSKMDIRNLATVIAPNVLYSPARTAALDNDPMYAIDGVECLITHIEEMCMIPDSLDTLLGDPQLFTNAGEITTKEILKRFQELQGHRPPPDLETFAARQQDGSTRPPARRVETDPSVWQGESSVRPVMQHQQQELGPMAATTITSSTTATGTTGTSGTTAHATAAGPNTPPHPKWSSSNNTNTNNTNNTNNSNSNANTPNHRQAQAHQTQYDESRFTAYNPTIGSSIPHPHQLQQHQANNSSGGYHQQQQQHHDNGHHDESEANQRREWRNSNSHQQQQQSQQQQPPPQQQQQPSQQQQSQPPWGRQNNNGLGVAGNS